MIESVYIPNAEFAIWSVQHLMWLLFAGVSTGFWVYLGRKAKTEQAQNRIGMYMTLLGVGAWILAEILMPLHGQWETQSGWPLHLCYFLHFVMPLMLLWRSYAIFDVVYPILMAGCFQALLTPDLMSGFPHFHNLRYFLVHIALVQSGLYAIFVFRFRPTFRGIFKCLLFINVYAVIVSGFNWILNTNFMYLRAKPPGTVLDLFGEWPSYLLGAEFLALTLFFIAWLPFSRTKSPT